MNDNINNHNSSDTHIYLPSINKQCIISFVGTRWRYGDWIDYIINHPNQTWPKASDWQAPDIKSIIE
jgi:hypothetical protein